MSEEGVTHMYHVKKDAEKNEGTEKVPLASF